MLWLELAVVLACIVVGSRLSGIGMGVMGGIGLVVLVLLTAMPVHAQQRGFATDRYVPTPAGEWSFWVDRPWYSDTRWFAAGLTIDYGNNPLVLHRLDAAGESVETTAVIGQQVIAHLDVAGSFHDRVNVSASMPITKT